MDKKNELIYIVSVNNPQLAELFIYLYRHAVFVTCAA